MTRRIFFNRRQPPTQFHMQWSKLGHDQLSSAQTTSSYWAIRLAGLLCVRLAQPWPGHCEPAAAVWMGELVCLCRVADPTTGQHKGVYNGLFDKRQKFGLSWTEITLLLFRVSHRLAIMVVKNLY